MVGGEGCRARGGGDKAVYHIKFIGLFGEHYQSKISAVSQSAVETTNPCIRERANTSNPDW